MSVIITGVEMPKSCDDCGLCQCKVPELCPLKPVDGLLEEFMKMSHEPACYIPNIEAWRRAYNVVKTYCEVEK